MSKKTGLGKGLGALIDSNRVLDDLTKETQAGDRVSEIFVDKIKPNPYQPRQDFNQEELQNLADSIREQGLLQPIVVREKKDGFELVVGERRLRACKLAEKTKIPAIVRNYTDSQSMNFALLENLQRTDLNPMEVAAAYKRLMQEGGMTQEELSKKLGVSRPKIANTLRLLNLPEPVQNYVRKNLLTESAARTIAGLPNAAAMQEVAKDAAENKLSILQIEAKVKNRQAANNEKPHAKKKDRTQKPEVINCDVDKLIRELEYLTGEKIEIVPAKNGKGKVIGFKFASDSDLNRIREIFLALNNSLKAENKTSPKTKKLSV